MHSVSEPEVELLRRAAVGDRNAFGELFERYQHTVYRFARAMTGSDEAADDVTQEVFVILMRDLTRYSPERSALRTYLYGVARNVSRNRIRRDRRLSPLLSVTDAAHGHPSGPDPYERLLHAEQTDEILRGLARLPRKMREAVILCDLHALSYAEASSVLGTSVAAVRSRLHRGRHLLRIRLSRLQLVVPHSASRVSRPCPV